MTFAIFAFKIKVNAGQSVTSDYKYVCLYY